jgi:hypothetical protein
MNDFTLFARMIVAASAGFGLLVWGVGMTLFAPRGWVGRLTVAAAGAVVGASGVAAFLPANAISGAVVAGGVALGLTAFGSGRVRAGLTAIARFAWHPRAVGATVAVLATGWGGYEFWRYERAVEAEANQALEAAGPGMPATQPAKVYAVTDRGDRIPLKVPEAPLSPTEAADAERTAYAIQTTAGRWIRRATADDHSNCHGWVFTGGRFLIDGSQVTEILDDNGYAAVVTPQAGDLCVYRNSNGGVSHTGVVRAVLTDGTVLVEGKWGRLGVYLHAAQDSCYGTNFTYHRSPRAGHLLAGMDSPADLPAVAVAPPSP